MSETRCPRCQEPLRLPERLPSGDASAQCPWCSETFPLHELLDRLPPMLQIVDAGSGLASEPPAAQTEPWREHAAASPWGDGASDEEDEVDASYLIREEAPAGEITPPTPTVRPSPRRTPKASPIKSLLQIVAGGLVSIPLALLILLLLKYLGVANPNVGFWPLDGKPLETRLTAVPPPKLPTTPSANSPQPSGRLLGEEMPDFGEMDPAADLDEMLESTANPPAENAPAENETSGNETVAAPPADTPAADDVRPSSDDGSTPEDDSATAGPPAEKGASSLIEEAQQAARTLAAHQDAATRPGVVKDLYLALAELAAAEPTEPTEPTPGYGALFDQLRGGDQLATMGRFGQPWLAASQRVHEGLFAVGSLVEQEAGYALQWEDGTTAPVTDGDALSADPADFVGKQVAVLAKIDTAADPPRLQLRYLERFDLASPETTQP